MSSSEEKFEPAEAPKEERLAPAEKGGDFDAAWTEIASELERDAALNRAYSDFMKGSVKEKEAKKEFTWSTQEIESKIKEDWLDAHYITMGLIEAIYLVVVKPLLGKDETFEEGNHLHSMTMRFFEEAQEMTVRSSGKYNVEEWRDFIFRIVKFAESAGVSEGQLPYEAVYRLGKNEMLRIRKTYGLE